MNTDPSNWLAKAGLTTHDQEDFGAIQLSPKVMIRNAYCTSLWCAERDSKGRKKVDKKVKKRAHHNQVNCTDCGDTLFWETKVSKTRTQ